MRCFLCGKQRTTPGHEDLFFCVVNWYFLKICDTITFVTGFYDRIDIRMETVRRTDHRMEDNYGEKTHKT